LQRLGLEKTATLANFIEDYESLGFSVQEVQKLAEWRKSLAETGISPELKAIAEWLADWAKNINELSNNHNLITLGDFNIDREGDDLYNAFISTGLKVPKDLPRSSKNNIQN